MILSDFIQTNVIPANFEDITMFSDHKMAFIYNICDLKTSSSQALLGYNGGASRKNYKHTTEFAYI